MAKSLVTGTPISSTIYDWPVTTTRQNNVTKNKVPNTNSAPDDLSKVIARTYKLGAQNWELQLFWGILNLKVDHNLLRLQILAYINL